MKQTEELVFSDRVSASTSISTIFAPYDLPRSTLDELTVHLSRSSKLPDFLMHFQHTLEEPSGSRAMMCAFTIASGYFIGGFIPLIPYFLVAEHQVVAALCLSSVIMIIALFLFGYGKTCFVSGWRGPMNVRKAVTITW
jgi:vacuolar iron transporter family protein